jgi:hypothetical protein
MPSHNLRNQSPQTLLLQQLQQLPSVDEAQQPVLDAGGKHYISHVDTLLLHRPANCHETTDTLMDTQQLLVTAESRLQGP